MGVFDRIFANKAQPTGDPPELRRQIEKAMNGLSAATTAHDATLHLGQAAWDVDQDTGRIAFTTPQGTRAEAPVQIIGTYNTEDGSWLWGWDHPSVAPALAEHAKKVLAYGREHGFTKLTTRKLQCTEEECWELTALAYFLCSANGAYRGPSGAARVFMTFGELRLSKAS
jgi:hypothetical protein